MVSGSSHRQLHQGGRRAFRSRTSPRCRECRVNRLFRKYEMFDKDCEPTDNAGQSEGKGQNMKRSHLIAVLVGFMAIVAFANTASAYYHPGLGRFTSRDPGPARVGSGGMGAGGQFVQRDQYVDGMNLYQYVRSSPTRYLDPSGTEAIKGNKYGDWDFTQKNTNAARAGAGYVSEVTITFKPKDKCACDEIAFVQTTRGTDTTTGKHEEARDNFKNRMTSDGWTIDRVDRRKYGWYGYDNDDTASGITPGKAAPGSLVDAVLFDAPGFSRVNWRREFEACAICKKGKDALNVYGCLTWGYEADKDGKLTSLKVGVTDGPSKAFTAAVDAWNDQAKGPADKRNHPDQVQLGPFIVAP